MTRKTNLTTHPLTGALPPEIDQEAIERDLAAANTLADLRGSYGQGRDLVNQLLGQAQAFQAAGDLLRTFGVSKLAIVKENKLYQQLAGSRTPNGSELKGTWVEFCNLLGISDDKANQDIANLQAFGEEALEQMQRVGIGYRDLRQFRRLPADQRTALIAAAKEGDKDTLLELAEDLIAKHVKEKAALETALTESAADLAAKDDELKRQSEEATKLREEAVRRTRYSPEQAAADAAALRADRMAALSGAAQAMLAAMNDFGLALAAVVEDPTDREEGMNTARWLAQCLADLYVHHQVDVDFAETVTPAWLAAAQQAAGVGV